MMQQIRKWGNSLGVVIPATEVRRLGLTEDMEVEITLKPKNPMRMLYTADLSKISSKVVEELRGELEPR